MSEHVAYPGCYCADCVEGANTSVSRYCAELNITNADHIALWLETNTEEPRIGWLAVQIAEAYERTINRKHVFYSPGEPDCPSDLLCSNGELHTLRCKVCGEENLRLDMPCKGEITSTDTPSARITGDKDRENSVEGAPHYAMLQVSVALYDALRRNRIGWENAIDLDLLPERHRPAAQALIDEADTILKQWREVTL